MRKPRRFPPTTRQWLYHRRFKATPLAIALAYALFLTKSIGKLRNANESQLNAHDAKRRAREICSRKVYNISSVRCNERCYAIVVTVNMGFYDFFLNWHHHYTKSLSIREDDPAPNQNYTTLLVVVAEDIEIYNKLLSRPFDNTEIVLGANSSTQPADYDSAEYKSLVSGRASHLLNLMCGLPQPTAARNKMNETLDWNGWIVVYSDIDTVWLQDPIPIVESTLFAGENDNLLKSESCPKYDILASVDDHTTTHPTYYCTGFLVVASTAPSINFLSEWEQELKLIPRLNQPIFNKLIHGKQLAMRHGSLSEKGFPSGKLFFDGNASKSQVPKETVVVHNNYIIGRDAKKRRFEEYGLWNTTKLYS